MGSFWISGFRRSTPEEDSSRAAVRQMAIKSLTVLALLADASPVVLPPTGFLWEQNGRALISDGGADVQIKRRSNMSSSRSGSRPKKSGHASHGEARPGAAGPGETFDPTRMPH